MTQPRPQTHLETMAVYHAGVAYAPCDKLIRLSFNEGAFGPGPAALAAYRNAAGCLSRYPDLGYTALRETLAATFGLDAARIVCGAGSDDLLNLLARAYAGPGDEIIYSQYGFAMYAVVAKAAGATGVVIPEKNFTLDIDALLAAVTPRTRIVFVANPNNPTGSYFSRAELARLHEGLPPRVLLVLDTAYAEYMAAADYSDGLDLAARAPNVVVTRTFSKIHALGGLRIGWCYGPPAIVDVLNRLRNPFNIAAPAAAAAMASLGDHEFLARSRDHNIACRARFAAALHEIGGFHIHPGAANFLLVGIGSAVRAQALYDALAARSIQLRPMGGYGLPDHLRITIGSDAEMDALLAAIRDFCAREHSAA